ncbi:hypothetical protein [Streptomyces sp. DSM 40907]|uniref:hypothetical protein n=1 Tax=Streptomyces kutzneri TaxID=3051179 RepID=UPI0028D37BD1|nr:hypothetical protein [Streptomyces sp. DSM 40907]
MRNEKQDALKVGVASAAVQELRLRAHQRQGWTTELRIEFETGHQALQAERAVLSFLRSCGATSTVSQASMPQGGYTETLAHANSMGLHLKDLLQTAQLAGRLVRRAHCPWSRAGRTLRDAIGEVQRLIDRNQMDLAREVLAEVLPLMLKLAQALELEDMVFELQDFMQALEAKRAAAA